MKHLFNTIITGFFLFSSSSHTTILHDEVKKGNKDTVLKLLSTPLYKKNKNKINQLTKEDSKTSLLIAVERCDIQMIKILLSAGADPYQVGLDLQGLLFSAATRGDLELVAILFNVDLKFNFIFNEPIEAVLEVGPVLRRLLISEARKGNLELIKLLLHFDRKHRFIDLQTLRSALFAAGENPEHILTLLFLTEMMTENDIEDETTENNAQAAVADADQLNEAISNLEEEEEEEEDRSDIFIDMTILPTTDPRRLRLEDETEANFNYQYSGLIGGERYLDN